MPLFAFDLDGTVTDAEILPRIAAALGLAEEMALLTRLTLNGTLDFAASFRLRFHILKSLPLRRIQAVVEKTPINPAIAAFIAERPADCVILTGNLDTWVEPLRRRLACPIHTSRSGGTARKPTLESILDKGETLRRLGPGRGKVVAVGESVNDIPMFKAADVAVAYSGVHPPLPAILRLADHHAPDSESLCALLRSL